MESDVLRRWNQLYILVNNIQAVGAPGLRDPDSPCSYFKPEGDDVTDSIRECLGDGHYMCGECQNLTKTTDNCFGDYTDMVLFEGSWKCNTSPIGVCQYLPEDIAHDFCIHCGEPDERK